MSWRLASSLVQLRYEVQNKWPGTTVWTIGDAAHAGRGSDHNPNPQGVVCAVDVVGRDIAGFLWKHLRETRDPRIKYLIFNRQIVSATTSPWVVRNYSGSNPHADHIHISVGRGPDGRSTRPDLYDSKASWGLGTASKEDDVFVVRFNERGPRVARIQRVLKAAGEVRFNGTDLLPRFGMDGHYGNETAAAVDRLAKLGRLPEEGKTGMDVLLLDLCRHWLESGRG